MRETVTTDKRRESNRGAERIDSVLLFDEGESEFLGQRTVSVRHSDSRATSSAAPHAVLANATLERGLKNFLEYSGQQLKYQRHLGIKIVALGFLCLSLTAYFYGTPASKQRTRLIPGHKADEASRYANRAVTIASVQPKAALDNYRKALSLEPDSNSIRLQYAALLLRQNRTEEALSESKLVLESDAANAEAQRIAGICYQRAGDAEDAIPLLESVLERGHGSRADLCYQLYLCAMQLERSNQAEMYIDEAVEDAPTNVRYHLDRAKLKLSMSKVDDARKDLLLCLELAPHNGESKFLSGMCDAQAQRYRTAIGNFELAESLGYRDSALFFERSKAYSRLERYHEALSDINRYLESFPSDTKALRRKEMYENAISYRFTQARCLPNDFHYNSAADAISAGYDALNTGNTKKALTILDAVVRANPNEPLARKYLAHALFRSEKYEESAIQFQKWTALQPAPSEEIMSFSNALRDREQYKLAANVLSPLMTSQPNNHQARMLLVKSLELAGDTEEAKTNCREGIARTRNRRELDFYNSFLNRELESLPQE